MFLLSSCLLLPLFVFLIRMMVVVDAIPKSVLRHEDQDDHSRRQSHLRRRVVTSRALMSPAKVNGETTNGVIVMEMQSACEQAVQAVAALQQELEALPEHFWPDFEVDDYVPTKQPGDFDVAAYMEALPQIALPPGRVLDWVYDLNWGGGKPVIYVRDVFAPPFATFPDYVAASCAANGDCPHYLDEITPAPPNSPQGYMQMAVLHVMAEQFYLYWHALLNEFRIVANQEMVLNVVDDISRQCNNAPTGADLDRLLKIDLTPIVAYNNNKNNNNNMDNMNKNNTDDSSVTVTLVVFNMWGGFYRKSITFAAEGIRSVDYENVFEYNACFIY